MATDRKSATGSDGSRKPNTRVCARVSTKTKHQEQVQEGPVHVQKQAEDQEGPMQVKTTMMTIQEPESMNGQPRDLLDGLLTVQSLVSKTASDSRQPLQ